MYNLFQLASADQSVVYLGQIFGTVGIALSGTGPALLSIMFKTFNTGMLVLGALMVAYTTVVGVLATAQEGKFLGEKWNSLWVPLRTLLGLVALFPTKSGYCAAQVVIMWFVVQGIGSADMVWNTVVNYFKTAGGTTRTDPGAMGQVGNVTDASGNPAIVNALKGLMKNAVCQAALTKFVNNNASSVGHSTPWTATYKIGDQQQTNQVGFQFGVKSNPDECGVISWVGNVYKNPPDPIPADFDKNIFVGTQQAVQALVPVFENIANYYVNLGMNNKNCWNSDCTGPPPLGNCKYFDKYINFDFSSSSCPIRVDFQSSDGASTWDSVLSYVGTNFVTESIKLIAGAANNYSVNAQTGKPVKEDPSSVAMRNGWIFAGAYYYNFATADDPKKSSYTNFMNQIWVLNLEEDPRLQGGDDPSLKSRFATPEKGVQIERFPHLAGYGRISSSGQPVNPSALPVQYFYCGSFRDDPTGACKNDGGAVKLFDSAYNHYNASGGAEGQTAGFYKGAVGGGSGVTNNLAPVADGILRTWMDNLTAQKQDPLVTVGHFGKQLLIAAETLFWIHFSMVVAFGIAGTYITFLGTTANYGAGVIQAISQFLMTPVWFLLAYMISIGGLLGVYTPLIPYINFTFGAIGWFLAVIEAMVAGPIIALGILSPGGQNEILGRAEGAVMILLNIFLRPTLMVFGMMFAMLLGAVLIAFINAAFLNVVSSIVDKSSSGGTMGLLELLLFIMAYAMLVITALNKCFSLIGLLPDQILRWIGGSPERYGAGEEAGEAVKGGVAGGAAAGRAGMQGAIATPKHAAALKKTLGRLAKERDKAGGISAS